VSTIVADWVDEAAAGMRMLISLVQPDGTDGATGFALGVPCVTPTATWLSSSP